MIKIGKERIMRKYILSLVLVGNLVNAQVSIGKQVLSGSSSILEFSGMTQTGAVNDAETANIKGLILPAVASSPVFTAVNPSTNHPQNGTFVFDNQVSKVRMFENGTWLDMTDPGNSSATVPVAGIETGNGVIIGASSSSAKGALVLESSNKAMILPQIKNPHLTVKSPYPGMMCFDTVSNSVAVFDGNKWSYWK
ncbi:hypothetical protein [uncultured Chryseobacterium sp.]|uniref:hypothetical protein n=2 Tax=Chryseobacterium TaxID=59732 RepID=UPI003748D68B